MAYANFKGMTGITTSDKVSRDKAFNIAAKKKKKKKMLTDINMDLLHWFINFSIKNLSGSVVKSKLKSNKE